MNGMNLFVRTLGAAAVCCATSAAMAQSLAAGVGCVFPLEFTSLAAGHQSVRLDKSNVLIFAGQFGTLQVSNPWNQESITLPGKGAVLRSVRNPDGSATNTFTGHWVVSWFPGDNPAGPQTIEYVGRLTIRQVGEQSTLLSLDGKQVMDICAALS
jgi:hypothetical protein